jgi:hypothetical protein
VPMTEQEFHCTRFANLPVLIHTVASFETDYQRPA